MTAIFGLGTEVLSAATASFVGDPTTVFTVVNIPNNDPLSDQQTGQADGDIVGSAANPAFYTSFDGTNVYYRTRLGAVQHQAGQPTFAGFLWVGIDANLDGRIDVYLAVNKDAYLEFRAPGPEANNSPSTTSIQNAAANYKIAQTANNTLYGVVSTVLQPGITNLDLNSDGTDAFLTFRVPFLGTSGSASIQGALSGIAGISVNELSAIRYILGTSTEGNSLNQDFGGVDNKNFDKNATWAQLGAFSPRLTADGTTVPEPSTWGLMLCGAGFLAGAGTLRARRDR